MPNKTDRDKNIRIGAMLRDAREAGKVTQAEMSEAVDITKNHISAIERGVSKAPISMLLGYCDRLGVTPNDILGYSNADIPMELLQEIRRMSPEDQERFRQIAILFNRNDDY